MSAYERNRLLLNTADGKFADLSHASGGADLDSDSRAIVAADFNNDQMPDLLIRSSGGGPLRLFLNRFPKSNRVQLNLQGTRSNRRGIGARISARVGDQSVHREVQVENGFRAQNPPEVSLGLGQASQIDVLQIRWPSGHVQELKAVQPGRYLVNEDTGLIAQASNAAEESPAP